MRRQPINIPGTMARFCDPASSWDPQTGTSLRLQSINESFADCVFQVRNLIIRQRFKFR